MRVKLHQEAAGKKPGEFADVDESYGKYLVAEGYASTAGDADGVHATSVPAQHDPRLAENREAPGEEDIDRDPVTPRPTLAYPDPIERTNGKGDPEKGAKGKETLERAAVRTDAAEQAVEENPELAADATKEGDKVEASSAKVEDAKADTDTTEEAAEAAKKVTNRRRS